MRLWYFKNSGFWGCSEIQREFLTSRESHRKWWKIYGFHYRQNCKKKYFNKEIKYILQNMFYSIYISGKKNRCTTYFSKTIKGVGKLNQWKKAESVPINVSLQHKDFFNSKIVYEFKSTPPEPTLSRGIQSSHNPIVPIASQNYQ